MAASGGYAEGVLREMYGNNLPRAASRLLKDHAASQAQNRSSSAPGFRTGTQLWSTGSSERPAERRRVDLKVPRVGQGKPGSTGRPPPAPAAKKSQATILADTSNYERQDRMPPPQGVGYQEQKRQLQDRCSFGFGSALPTTQVMASTPLECREFVGRSRASRSPKRSSAKRVTFASSLPPSREGGARHEKSGLTPEQERMAADIVEGVSQRQQELQRVEKALEDCTSRVEAPGQAANRRRLLVKEMATASQRRLELRNAISRDVQDLEQLMDLSPADS